MRQSQIVWYMHGNTFILDSNSEMGLFSSSYNAGLQIQRSLKCFLLFLPKSPHSGLNLNDIITSHFTSLEQVVSKF